jgi:hypothetical protein
MADPRRIQIKRTKGWRKPEGAIVVARPSKWGNPFTVAGAIEAGYADNETDGHALVVREFGRWLRGSNDIWLGPESDRRRQEIIDLLPSLRGHDLACWCPVDKLCHADVLLELANRSSASATRVLETKE